jgi:hypothetical protein
MPTDLAVARKREAAELERDIQAQTPASVV